MIFCCYSVLLLEIVDFSEKSEERVAEEAEN